MTSSDHKPGAGENGAGASKYSGDIAELVAAWHARDEKRFFSLVDAMAAEQQPDGLLGDVVELTREIESALEHFCSNARLQDLTQKEVPDARVSLEHVLSLTSEAAHRTMDLVERSYAPAERTRELADRIGPMWAARRGDQGGKHTFDPPAGEVLALVDEFLESARSDAEEIRRNLGEVLMAQTYQDLSGQIIRSVISLIDEIHSALGGLVALSRGEAVDFKPREEAAPKNGVMGPRIPGVSQGDVVAGQDDIDQLLSGLGI